MRIAALLSQAGAGITEGCKPIIYRQMPAILPSRITSSYDGFFLNAFYVCVLRFYDAFFSYHKA